MAITSFKGKYFFLSNFFPDQGCSLEHSYQAAKATSPDDHYYVMGADGPGEAKRRGRKIACRPNWDEIKDDIMFGLLLVKFADPRLKQALLDTGDEYLQEGNTWGDTYWGVCDGKGQNRLGELLMDVRFVYRDG